MGWVMLSNRDDSLAAILSHITSTGSRGHPDQPVQSLSDSSRDADPPAHHTIMPQQSYKGLYVVRPVQFVIQMNPKALRDLNVHTVAVQWFQWRMFVPVEVYHHLFGFSNIYLEVVVLAPVHKVLSQFSILLVIPISDEPNNCRVVRELL
ncbi:hypothetical protein AMECASPLE_034629 [Ameca splendens]|uniref:Uncharacterized protein n=1 Tax=Ameca splendens TaxID=208324 RepID=A0ABV1A5N9_9TELE